MTTVPSRKYPWLKFYPGDYRADPALRICSIGARGLWMEMLCLMHEAVPYGYLISKGSPVTTPELASLTGISTKQAEKLVAELQARGVFSVTDDGIIFSRRMVRDLIKRNSDSENGKLGGNPRLIRGVNPRLKAQTLESRIQSYQDGREVALDRFLPSRVAPAGKVHVKAGTPQWTAWTEYNGKSFPTDNQFGWLLPSEWPPGFKSAEDTEGDPKKMESTP